MELAELLESEGVDPDELMTWAQARAGALVAELGDDERGGPLLQLLERDASLDVAAVSVPPAQPVVVEAPIEQPEASFDDEPGIEVADEEPAGDPAEPSAIVDEPPSEPLPISAAELPPPPEPPRLADGEPEPMLETFDTGAIHLGTPEADALLAGTSTRRPEAEPAAEAEAAIEAEPAITADPAAEAEPPLDQPAEASANEEHEEHEEDEEDELEELELDELVELDDEELEVLDDEPEPPPPPPPPPSGGPPPVEAEPPPVQTGDTAAFPTLDDAAPVQTGSTAAHPIVEQAGEAADEPRDQPENVDLDAPSPAEDEDDFDLDFDD
ncbi:MAG: hypothetical protein R6X02_26450 [Enhygromyxa sp.]